MKRITITTRLGATDGGRGGAFLFLLAPIAGAFAWRWYVSALVDRVRGNTLPESVAVEVAAALCFACGLAFLIGCLLVFYGRTYTHEVEIGDERLAAPARARDDDPRDAAHASWQPDQPLR